LTETVGKGGREKSLLQRTGHGSVHRLRIRQF
jgi:hypothetical protein